MAAEAMIDDVADALAGLVVVDLARGMAPALVTKALAEMGCRVARFEPTHGDPFETIYPAYRAWHHRASVEQVDAADAPAVLRSLATADVCIVGGEDFPDLRWAVDEALLEQFPDLVVLVIEATPSETRQMPAVELLAQARSGLVFEQHRDRPVALAFAPASYCAALHGLTALFAGLCHRARGGTGQIVRTSLLEGALTLGVQYWVQATKPVGHFNFGIPKDPWPLIFRCRDGRHVHFVLGSVGSKGSVYRILGIDDPNVKPEDSGMPNPRAGLKNFFGDIDLLAEYVARIDSADLMAQLGAAGVAANYVMAPGECWDDPQVVHLGTIKTDAKIGRYVGLPLRGRFAAASAKSVSLPRGSASLPLTGIRILDFGLFVAGPFAGVALADLGADVIKIETPQGDPNRMVYRSYAAVNRGKRALTIDLKSKDGQAIANRLIDSAEVVLNNFRPGVSVRLGVDPATLHGRDPDKIVLEATGFGRSGPRGDQPGFDMIFQALCGHEVRAGGIGGAPLWDRTAMVDYLMGLIDQVAVLVALWRRLTGRGGADLDVSLLDAGLFLMSELIVRSDGELIGAPPLNAARTGFHPAEALYECADGWIAIAARGDAMAAALAAAFGIHAPPRARWSDREQAAIGVALRGSTVADAVLRLDRAGVWAEPCSPAGDRVVTALASCDPPFQLIGNDPMFGEVRQVGALFRLGGERSTNPRRAPLAGEHTRELLAELGYLDDEIGQFLALKVVA